jgi:hypothetical protein
VNSHLGLNEMLALLDQLRSVIQDFATREEKLAAEFRTRSSAEVKAFETATRERTSRLSAAIADAEAAFENEKEKWRVKSDKRKEWIGRAHLVTTRQIREGEGGREGYRKQRIQEGLRQAEHDREMGLANATGPWQISKPNWPQVPKPSARWKRKLGRPFVAMAHFADCSRPTGNGRKAPRCRMDSKHGNNSKVCRRPSAQGWTNSKNFHCRDFLNSFRSGCF